MPLPLGGSVTDRRSAAAHASRRWITDGFLVRPVRDGRFEIPVCGLLIPPARAQAQPLGETLEQPQLLYVATPLALVIIVLGLRCQTGNGIADELSDAQRQRVAVIGRASCRERVYLCV